MTLLSRVSHWSARADDRGSIENPLRLVKIAVAAILLIASVFAVLAAASGVEPRALRIVGVCWAVYGFVVALLDDVLEPLVDGVARGLQNGGLRRAGGGYSAIEALVAGGHHAAAADAYLERAREERGQAEPALRRAALLAGPLMQPEAAAAELDALRGARALVPEDDVRVGLALADLWEHRLGEPGRAMGELRRLLDRYPSNRRSRRIRAELADLKARRFAAP
ncbi:MAG: hypothetical protein ACREOF_07825 [Gemmatimonadales bacterium]